MPAERRGIGSNRARRRWTAPGGDSSRPGIAAMKFTVTWSRNAERKLARRWMAASDRRSVTQAANSIDTQLAQDPLNAGESRSGNRRILHEPPLGVIFSVVEADRTVLVLDVWKYDKRPRD